MCFGLRSTPVQCAVLLYQDGTGALDVGKGRLTDAVISGSRIRKVPAITLFNEVWVQSVNLSGNSNMNIRYFVSAKEELAP